MSFASLVGLRGLRPLRLEPGVLFQIYPTAIRKKPDCFQSGFLRMAVGQGFEPWDLLQSTVFKTAAFDHSATPPNCAAHYTGLFCVYKCAANFFSNFKGLAAILNS